MLVEIANKNINQSHEEILLITYISICRHRMTEILRKPKYIHIYIILPYYITYYLTIYRLKNTTKLVIIIIIIVIIIIKIHLETETKK